MDKSRTEILIGKDGLSKLESKHIIVVGVGGVGGNCAMNLLRSGIEKLTLVDFDVVSSSNANRQIVADENTIGQKKVDVLKNMLLSINSNAQINIIDTRITQENIPNIIKDCDMVVDAIDSVKDKVALIVYCKQNNINIISAMGAGNRYDVPSFVCTDIYKTHDDGLAKVLRKKLKENRIKKLDVVCSFSPAKKTEKVVGSISYYPAVAGATICAVIVNKILKGEI